MLRWIDLIGIVGFAMVVLSNWLLFPRSADRMTWKYWLEGLALWLVGFNSVVAWLLVRWSVRQSKTGPPPLLVWSLRQWKQREITPEEKGSHLRTEKAA
jgi:hypothetical protein